MPASAAGDTTAHNAVGDELQLTLPTHKLRCQHPTWRPAIIVACGSYNPPTIMHMRMFDLAIDRLAQEQIEVWGGYLSPVHEAYKKAGLAPGHNRHAMCEAAVQDHPFLMCDPWELRQEGYTRTLTVLRRFQVEVNQWWGSGGRPQHTLQLAPQPPGSDGSASSHLSQEIQPQGPPQVLFLCGEDVLLSMAKPGVWHQPEVLLEEFPVVCVERPLQGLGGGGEMTQGEVSTSEVQEVLEKPDTLLNTWRHHIHVARDVAKTNISSTLVRKQLQQSKSIRYLVPPGVLNYMQQNPALYHHNPNSGA